MRNIDRTQSIGIASSKVLEKNLSRTSALFCNESANKIYLQLGFPAVSGAGIPIAAGGNYEIGFTNYWDGEVHALAAGAGSLLQVIEESVQ